MERWKDLGLNRYKPEIKPNRETLPMNILFAPVLRVFRHLNWNIKFALVGSIALVVMSLLVVLSGLGELKAWKAAEDEALGLKIFEPGLSLLIQLQQHRGMSAGALGGNASMREKLD